MLQQVNAIEDILPLAGKLFTKEKEIADSVTKTLLQREMQAQTYISNLEIMLFHCKTQAVKHCRFGYIGLREPFFPKKHTGLVRGAVVMLAPEKEPICLQTMSAVSGALIENKELIKYLHSVDQNAFVTELERCLGKYYENTLQNLYHPQKIL